MPADELLLFLADPDALASALADPGSLSAPRRRGLRRLLEALEVPDCDCDLVPSCRCDGECKYGLSPDKKDRPFCERCGGRCKCRCACCVGLCNCPPALYQPPCEHMRRWPERFPPGVWDMLEVPIPDPVSGEESPLWAMLLRLAHHAEKWTPAGYDDPPADDTKGWKVVTPRHMLLRLLDRSRRSVRFWHPGDDIPAHFRSGYLIRRDEENRPINPTHEIEVVSEVQAAAPAEAKGGAA